MAGHIVGAELTVSVKEERPGRGLNTNSTSELENKVKRVVQAEFRGARVIVQADFVMREQKELEE